MLYTVACLLSNQASQRTPKLSLRLYKCFKDRHTTNSFDTQDSELSLIFMFNPSTLSSCRHIQHCCHTHSMVPECNKHPAQHAPFLWHSTQDPRWLEQLHSFVFSPEQRGKGLPADSSDRHRAFCTVSSSGNYEVAVFGQMCSHYSQRQIWVWSCLFFFSWCADDQATSCLKRILLCCLKLCSFMNNEERKYKMLNMLHMHRPRFHTLISISYLREFYKHRDVLACCFRQLCMCFVC